VEINEEFVEDLGGMSVT